MKTKPSTFAVLALVTTIGVSTMTSTAFADDHSHDGGQRDHQMGPRHESGPMRDRARFRGGFPLLALTCAPEAAERFEAMLDNVGERLDLTEDQTIAYEDFRTAALSAQTGFSDTCAAFAGVDDGDTEPDLIDRLTQRQLMLSAQVEAMDSVLPALETFYDSLSDDQKADLMPHRGDRPIRDGMRGDRGDRTAPEAEATAAN